MARYVSGGLRRVAAVALVAALGVAGWAGRAAYAEENALKDTLLRGQAEDEAALYETTDGARQFVLDRTRRPPLLKFRDSFEVFALDAVPASRGDELLRVDTGEDLVRVTALGAVTLYPPERPTGVPATRLGPADPLPSLTRAQPNAVDAFMMLRAYAGPAELEAPVEPAGARSANALLADAARLTAEGLRAASEARGDASRTPLTRIQFAYGEGADARVEDGELRIQLDPSAGYAGRPSSLKVAAALRGGANSE